MDEEGIPEHIKDEVVRLYLANAKNREITEQTGVSRSSIYWILDKRGIAPNRQFRHVGGLDAAELLRQLTEAHQEIGRLRQELADHQEGQTDSQC